MFHDVIFTQFYAYRSAMVEKVILRTKVDMQTEMELRKACAKLHHPLDNHIVLSGVNAYSGIRFYVLYSDHHLTIGLGVREGKW